MLPRKFPGASVLLFHISHSAGQVFRSLFYLLDHQIQLVVGELGDGAAGADGGHGGTPVIKDGSAYAAVADLVFFVDRKSVV